MSNLMTASELAERLRAGDGGHILDVRWRLDKPNGHDDYLAGHIPGAVYVDMDTELAAHGDPTEGRHPLPTTEALQESARRWGINNDDLVVVYDDAKSFGAARAWWLLRQAGVNVRVLDGGWQGWLTNNGRVETGEHPVAAGSVTLQPLGTGALTIDEAAAFSETGVLIDARAPERFRGDVEPLDPIAGHIPGATNVPTTAHITDDGRLRDAATLRATFAEAGVTRGTAVAAYCGSGITAAHTALALSEIGIDAAVYPGSWSQWSNTPGRPVARGDN